MKVPAEFDLPLSGSANPGTGLRWRALRLLYTRAVDCHGAPWVTRTWIDLRRREEEVRQLMQDEARLTAWEQHEARRTLPIEIPDDLENASLADGVKRDQQHWADFRAAIDHALVVCSRLEGSKLPRGETIDKLIAEINQMLSDITPSLSV
jgi:hypothetical protein